MGRLDEIFAVAFRDFEVGDFPVSLGVEVTNHCNLRCPMCPREIADRGYGNIDWELFKNIVDQAAGRDEVLFLPQGFGESLIHPRFGDMLAYCRDAGIKLTMIVSNGTYLNEKNCNRIIDSGIAFINISLDGTVKDVYEKIRVNAKYEEVVENVKRFLRIRKERGATLPHVVMRMIEMKETADDVQRFREYWEPFLEEGDEIAYSTYQTWGNTVEDRSVGKTPAPAAEPAAAPRGPCRMIYKTMQIYYDGRTTMCCYDYDCEMEIGNVKEQSISEIWTGEKAAHYRRLHEEGRADEIAICKGCREFLP